MDNPLFIENSCAIRLYSICHYIFTGYHNRTKLTRKRAFLDALITLIKGQEIPKLSFRLILLLGFIMVSYPIISGISLKTSSYIDGGSILFSALKVVDKISCTHLFDTIYSSLSMAHVLEKLIVKERLSS